MFRPLLWLTCHFRRLPEAEEGMFRPLLWLTCHFPRLPEAGEGTFLPFSVGYASFAPPRVKQAAAP